MWTEPNIFMVLWSVLLRRASIVERTLSLSLAARPSTYNILLFNTKWGAFLLIAAIKLLLVTWTSCAAWLANPTKHPAHFPLTPLVLLVARLCLCNQKTKMLVLDMLQALKSWMSLGPRNTSPWGWRSHQESWTLRCRVLWLLCKRIKYWQKEFPKARQSENLRDLRTYQQSWQPNLKTMRWILRKLTTLRFLLKIMMMESEIKTTASRIISLWRITWWLRAWTIFSMIMASLTIQDITLWWRSSSSNIICNKTSMKFTLR